MTDSMPRIYDFTVDLPERRPEEPNATPFQQQMLVELGASIESAAGLGVDQASELIRAAVIGHFSWATRVLADDKSRSVLNPDEPIKAFNQYFELPDRAPGEMPATAAQARILRELQVEDDVCGSLGVDQASALIRDVARAAMEKRAVATVRRAARAQVM